MIIKDEVSNIKSKLSTISDLFDNLVIVDTGSTDWSIEELENIWIQPYHFKLSHEDRRIIEARNFSIEKNKCDRVLVLDWDESISRDDIKKIKQMDEPDPAAKVFWYFMKWQDYRYKQPFEDYKMSLINKNHVRFLFSVHACPQVYIRDSHGTWLRLNGITLHHYPIFKEYRKDYIKQLELWIEENPWCLRFYWFLGYYYFKNNHIDESIKHFEFMIKHINNRFPVEMLNAIMVLVFIYNSLWDTIKAFHYVALGIEYYETVKDDFEVRINFRLWQWFLDTKKLLLNDPNADLSLYEFAY